MPRLARQILTSAGALALALGVRAPASAQQGAQGVETSVSESAEITDTTEAPDQAVEPQNSEMEDEVQGGVDPVPDDYFPDASATSSAPSEESDYSTGGTDYYGSSADTGEPGRDLSLLYTGIGTFVAAYGLSGGIGESLHDESSAKCSYCSDAREMWIPLAGPWMLLADADNPSSRAAGAAMGVLQAGGLALLIAGIVDTVKSGKKSDSNVAVNVDATPYSAQARLNMRF